jgi:hypothetical protein
LRAGHGAFGGVGRRLGIAAAVTLALATAVSVGSESEARSEILDLPALPIAPSALPVDPPAVPIDPPPVPVPVEPPSIPKPPPVPVKPPSVPKLPSVPVKPPSVPIEPSAPVKQAPPIRSLPQPSLPGRSDRSDAPTSEPQVQVPTASLAADEPAQAGGTGSPGAFGALSEAAPGVASLPSRSELAKLPPARRRALLRAAFDTPLRGQRLQRLRSAIRAHRSCLGVLPHDGRRALELRAGLLGSDPVSRRVVARRIGTSPTAVLRIERSSLRRLFHADQRGLCDSGTAALGGGPPASSGDGPADVHEGGPGDNSQGASEAMLFLLLTLFALLGPLAAAALISQRRAANGAAAAARAGERPLLFLDVDGVIALDPLSGELSPGRIRASPLGLAYVPDRVGPLVRELATHFDIVWATGWEHYANAGLSAPLGLRDDLPVLTFGRRAQPGSSKWKIKRVDDYAGHRPVAWLDDNFVARHARWAAHRSAPTLLVPVDANAGLTPSHVAQLLRWADRVMPSSGEGGIRTLEGRCRP